MATKSCRDFCVVVAFQVVAVTRMYAFMLFNKVYVPARKLQTKNLSMQNDKKSHQRNRRKRKGSILTMKERVVLLVITVAQ